MRYLTPLLLLLAGCIDPPTVSTVPLDETSTDLPETRAVLPEPPLIQNTYDPFFDSLLCDGFDYPVGNADGKGTYTSKQNGKRYSGWYIAAETAEAYSLGIHTGEDWNGIGGGDTDLGQPVNAIGAGKVIAAADYGSPWGNIIMIEHHYLQNNQVDTIFSLYAHLDSLGAEIGQTVQRRELIGTIGTGGGAYPAHLHLEIRKSTLRDKPVDFWPSSNGWDSATVASHYLDPTAFISAHRTLFIPANAATLLFAEKSAYKMTLFNNGKLAHEYEIALSQNPNGHKVEQGDNRLPEGHYKIIQKSDGPFSGAMGPFFGAGWMRLNYPNPFDIAIGKQKGWISESKAKEMTDRWNAGKEPSKHTRLGGGIGIHGWNGDWQATGHQNLTWGCISMHNRDLEVMYDLVPLQTDILIVP